MLVVKDAARVGLKYHNMSGWDLPSTNVVINCASIGADNEQHMMNSKAETHNEYIARN